MSSSHDRLGRRLLVAAAVVVLLVVALLIWRGRGTREQARAPARTPTPRAVTQNAAPPLPPGAIESGAAGDPQAQLMAAAAAAQGHGPYPPGSQPLLEGSDPSTTVANDNAVDPLGRIHVVFGPRLDVVHPPDPLVIDMVVLDDKGHPLAVANPFAGFHSEREPPGSAGFRAPFADDGSGADRIANDLRYTVTYTPTPSERDALIGYVVYVEVGFDAPAIAGGGPRRYVTSLHYTPLPGAKLNGKFSDNKVGGSLLVDAGLSVARAGRYKVIASLYAADRQTAIAFAQQAADLQPGERDIQLQFFGKILHDRAIDGPYLLRYMMVFEEFPDRGTYWCGTTLDDAYTTHTYKALEFSPDPYVPPAPSGPEVTADSPSQRGKPGPIFGSNRRPH